MELSDQTISALAEIISGGSANDFTPPIGIYRQGWKIEQFMKSAGLEGPFSGTSRVTMTRGAIIQAMNLPDGGRVLTKLIERAADPRDFIGDEQRHASVVEYLNNHLIFDGLRLERDRLRMRLVQDTASASVVSAVAATAEALDFDTVARDVERALASAESDPEDAVTAACSIVESVCRSILVELGLGLPSKKDVQGLYQAVRHPLGLDPGKTGVPDLIADDVRAILGGLNTVVNGIGALRTHAGDAHGRERGYRRVDARIARLALHSASSAALFLIETWRQKFPDRALPRH